MGGGGRMDGLKSGSEDCLKQSKPFKCGATIFALVNISCLPSEIHNFILKIAN